MADDTIAFMESLVNAPAHLVGWSDGGVVALLVAIARPDLVRKVVAMGANFLPGPQSVVAPEMLEQMTPDAPDLATFRQAYEAVSPDGAAHWPVVVGKLADMYRTGPTIPTEDLARISRPTLVLVGDDDLIVRAHHCPVPRDSHIRAGRRAGNVARAAAGGTRGGQPAHPRLPRQ
ncbi:hypothetical protein GCM10010346_58150 [Streptomyces chryseus]|uniref:AB hydrolase-1 domain-containing protein n=1 Tax=Streptomyces chryseus TaxID=68186 RepID=A0ABQ3E598_9ACTN|nr:hypothetical protein GCM10010346_58150 [Streptomyces chryseus]